LGPLATVLETKWLAVVENILTTYSAICTQNGNVKSNRQTDRTTLYTGSYADM